LKRIAIIGHGFVGKAVDYGFTNDRVEKVIIDPIYNTTVENNLGILGSCHFIFVCVPTPFGEDGTIDATIFNKVMKRLTKSMLINTIIVIKSTVTPDIIRHWDVGGVVYNPEFLTEGFAKADFVRPKFHIIGGDVDECWALKDLYENYSLCDPAPFHFMSMAEASLVKYGINAFLATKITFFNQLYDAAQDIGANYSTIMKAIASDPRIGSSHTKVPGFDGKQGYGGACFPKDTNALINYSDRFTLVEECVRINNEYRAQYDLDERERQQNVTYANE